MFGYVKPINTELKVREYETYRAYYCGLCKTIKRNHNNISRFSLNYDFAFLGLLLASLTNEKEIIVTERCMVHPIKKRKVVAHSKALDYAAEMSLLLMYLKCEDDWLDDHDLKAKAMSIPFGFALKKQESALEEKRNLIETHLKSMQRLEKDNCEEVDEMAHYFGEIMAVLFHIEGLETTEDRILKHLGYLLGKWIYQIDALDDLLEDMKQQKYNPLKSLYSNGLSQDSFLDIMESTLYHLLSEIADTFELLNIKQNKGILENIFYLGLRQKTEFVLEKMRRDCIEKSI